MATQHNIFWKRGPFTKAYHPSDRKTRGRDSARSCHVEVRNTWKSRKSICQAGGRAVRWGDERWFERNPLRGDVWSQRSTSGPAACHQQLDYLHHLSHTPPFTVTHTHTHMGLKQQEGHAPIHTLKHPDTHSRARSPRHKRCFRIKHWLCPFFIFRSSSKERVKKWTTLTLTLGSKWNGTFSLVPC